MGSFKSAEIVSTKEGRQYHIGLRPGELAPYVLLCGDPARVRKVADHFDQASDPIVHREYVTVTGKYKGFPLSVMATGMGPDNTEIALVEMNQIVKNPTFLRIGTCGGLQKGMELGDLVISSGAVRLENTSTYFVHEGYPAVAHHEVVLALLEAVQKKGFRYHVGLTATAPGFYGAQSRDVPGFPPRNKELPQQLERMNVINFEMETSTLLILSQLVGVRAGTVCTMLANRHLNQFIDEENLKKAEATCIETGLEAMAILHQMDRKKGNQKYWLPSMGIK
ncbi:MAG: nucleoside phosphorylase [Deltaproteobacteria bacterium]|nr:nucleoside phosphorylase [Deltaproteobacteria bacterium]